MSKALSLLVPVIIFAHMVCGGSAAAQTEDDRPVIFYDSNLENVIRKAVGKPEGPLYPADLESITKLDIRAHVEDLTGLDYCVNQTELNLRVRNTNNLSPLASLTNLTELDLSGNPLNDESVNAVIPQLEERGVKVTR